MLQWMLRWHNKHLIKACGAPDTLRALAHPILSRPDHIAQRSQAGRTCCTLRWEYM